MNRIPKQLAITASLLLLSVFPALSHAQNNAPDSTQGQAMHEKHGDHNAMMESANQTDPRRDAIESRSGE
jgi:Spy/CpxP family protein refolding chaperone